MKDRKQFRIKKHTHTTDGGGAVIVRYSVQKKFLLGWFGVRDFCFPFNNWARHHERNDYWRGVLTFCSLDSCKEYMNSLPNNKIKINYRGKVIRKVFYNDYWSNSPIISFSFLVKGGIFSGSAFDGTINEVKAHIDSEIDNNNTKYIYGNE